MNYTNELRDYVIKMRRHFHKFPEVSFEEKETSKKIQEELSLMGIPFEVIGDYGVVGKIVGKKPGKVVALRADIDALSIKEENTCEFKSANEGFMHACGHDGHIATLLGSAKYLQSQIENIEGTIKLLFQQAEETGKGAKVLIEHGVLKDVEKIFGLHLWADFETGTVNLDPGARMAAVGVFKIELEGVGGHGAMPHQCVDPIVAGASLVQNLQTIISREVNPTDTAVITIGKFNSGSRFNVIAQEAVLEGTTRTFSKELIEEIPKKMERIIKYTGEAFRVKTKFSHEWAIGQVLVNDAEVVDKIQGMIKEKLPEINLFQCEKMPIGEDMAFLLNEVPGAFAFVGCGNKSKGIIYPHHHPKFDIDEDSLEIAVKLCCETAFLYLK